MFKKSFFGYIGLFVRIPRYFGSLDIKGCFMCFSGLLSFVVLIFRFLMFLHFHIL